MESPLLGSALPPNVGLSSANPNLVGLQCGYWTPDGKPKKINIPNIGNNVGTILCKRKEKNLFLKGTTPEDFEDENISLMTKRFSRMLKKGQVFQRRNSQKTIEKSNRSSLSQVWKFGSPYQVLSNKRYKVKEEQFGESKRNQE
ncbi:hypothetical protein H5410_005546 [Solanum commersonii]|uniref:Uncharacterized protein n=1 Tax=Solanum commersonii TaxID=4109 RepID=A0A9J6A7G3_SOLCO|nr:hypothetical protein H5410_005546 [Solanum commersonii]